MLQARATELAVSARALSAPPCAAAAPAAFVYPGVEADAGFFSLWVILSLLLPLLSLPLLQSASVSLSES